MIRYQRQSAHHLVADSYGYHSITNRLQGLVTLFPALVPFNMIHRPKGITVTKLVSSSKASWGEMDRPVSPIKSVSADPKTDRIGPVDVAMRQRIPTPKARLVVIGDAEFANDEYYGSMATAPC
jgi:hypothetical protein